MRVLGELTLGRARPPDAESLRGWRRAAAAPPISSTNLLRPLAMMPISKTRSSQYCGLEHSLSPPRRRWGQGLGCMGIVGYVTRGVDELGVDGEAFLAGLQVGDGVDGVRGMERRSRLRSSRYQRRSRSRLCSSSSSSARVYLPMQFSPLSSSVEVLAAVGVEALPIPLPGRRHTARRRACQHRLVRGLGQPEHEQGPRGCRPPVRPTGSQQRLYRRQDPVRPRSLAPTRPHPIGGAPATPPSGGGPVSVGIRANRTSHRARSRRSSMHPCYVTNVTFGSGSVRHTHPVMLCRRTSPARNPALGAWASASAAR